MHGLWQRLWIYLAGPTMHGYFSPTRMYSPNTAEFIGRFMLTTVNGMRIFCTGISPILALVAYNKSLINGPCILSSIKYTTFYYLLAVFVRAFGRISNPDYLEFVEILYRSRQPESDTRLMAQLKEYDYQIFAAPIDFTAKKKERFYLRSSIDGESYDFLQSLVLDILAYGAVHTFGRRMLYPGALSIFKTLLSNVYIENRKKLVVEEHGRRAILQTVDNNRIDSMFVDRRLTGDTNGSILVIACEGNAGSYETGIMVTPLSLGYSVLGWNHPGFAESSGNPLPSHTLAAVEAVMQYATEKLGFQEEQIVVFAWSIGGFPGSWIAANYPNIKGLILDATFDDLLPLALSRMPASWSPIIHHAIRKHLDLRVVKQLVVYNGPVLLIRRSSDEIIITCEDGTQEERRASNRANYLLKSLIKSRHPGLLDGFESVVDIWLAADPLVFSSINPDILPIVPSDFSKLSDSQRNQLIFYLCSRYLVDFQSGHNTPLDPHLFVIPTPISIPPTDSKQHFFKKTKQ